MGHLFFVVCGYYRHSPEKQVLDTYPPPLTILYLRPYRLNTSYQVIKNTLVVFSYIF